MSSERLSINVATQNILLDVTRTRHGQILPQDYRIGAMATTLANVAGGLDVVGIQEAHKSSVQHNGEVLAEMLGYGTGIWFEHNPPDPASGTGRKGEHVGLFGNMVEHAEKIDLGDRRIAVKTMIGRVAFITTHFRSGTKAVDKRYSQATELLAAIEDHPHAVLFGDFNESPGTIDSKARNLLEGDGGFVSAFKKEPPTWPTKQYSEVMLDQENMIRRIIYRRGLRFDGIYVRGDIEVSDAGVIEPVFDDDPNSLNLKNPEHYVHAPLAPSDHLGLRARVEIPVPTGTLDQIQCQGLYSMNSGELGAATDEA